MYILDYLLSKPFIESFLLMKCEAPTNYQITRKNNLPFVKIFLFGIEKTIRYDFRSTKNSLDYHSFLDLYIKENRIIFTIGYFCLFSKNSFPCRVKMPLKGNKTLFNTGITTGNNNNTRNVYKDLTNNRYFIMSRQIQCCLYLNVWSLNI